MAQLLQMESPLIGDLSNLEWINLHIPGGLILLKADADFTILEANHGYFDLVGYTRQEIAARFQNKGVQMVHPDDVSKAVDAFRAQVNSENPSFSIKARLMNQHKGFLWVNFSGRLLTAENGETLLSIIVVDISDHLKTAEQLREEQSFNALIASLSEDAFFDCDIQQKTMRYSKNFANKLGISETLANYPAPLLAANIIADDCLALFENQFQGDAYGIIEEEIHMHLPDGSDAWFLSHYHLIRDEQDKPMRAVGRMTDITRQRAIIEELSEKAEKDQLTGVYNKATTEYLIQETLKGRRSCDDKHALMIIDVDHFKTINDTFGHLYGDIVLTQLSDFLKPLFRSNDIIGRVGGDEFFVFVKNYKHASMLIQKATEICRLFHKTYTENEISVTISASIGISLFPDHASDFDTLYQNADIALYHAKASGKNTYAVYDGRKNPAYSSLRTEIDGYGSLQKSFHDNRVEYIFKLLYGSENPISSIRSVLQLITEHFQFSRGYIFENSPDGTVTSNTFEWCAPGIQPQIGNLQNIPIENAATAMASFEKTGMFLLKSLQQLPPEERVLLESQEICSMFQFGILDGKRIVGFIGFDDCCTERELTADAIAGICTICNLLATFLLRQRSQKAAKSNQANLTLIVEHIGNAVYVVDRANFQILFENQYARMLTDGSVIGGRCYEAYVGRSEPCENCPLPRLSSHTRQSSVVLTNHKLGARVQAVATLVDWNDGQDACLLSCTDITESTKE